MTEPSHANHSFNYAIRKCSFPLPASQGMFLVGSLFLCVSSIPSHSVRSECPIGLQKVKYSGCGCLSGEMQS